MDRLTSIRRRCFWLLPALVLAAGIYFRASGLFRGLPEDIVFHPDAPKQVMTLHHYLQGNDVQYFDDLFYDGYPYGLNRIDKALIRPANALLRQTGTWLNPDAPVERVPSRSGLYRWARLLRVLYGTVTILLVYAAARRLRFRPGPARTAALLYALAPLGATVTHSATGDVGLDLFLTLALWCMAHHAGGGHSAWIPAAAAACGMAFACKYQGALGLWMVGLPPLIDACRSRNGFRAFAKLCRQGVTALAGFLAGMLALTPAFFINFNRTWKDIRDNVRFIRHYGVDPAFFELPLRDRLAYGLGRNLPFVLESLGWVLSAAALLTACWIVARLVAAIRATTGAAGMDLAADDPQWRTTALLAAVFTFPLVALLLSTALKPAVQPFHFSFLLPFMSLAAAWLLTTANRTGQHRIAFVFGLLVLAALAEGLVTSVREDFFWRRGDTLSAARQFSNGVFRTPYPPRHRYRHEAALKHFFAEPSRLPVFRNRPVGIHHPETGWWRHHHSLPVPAIPLDTTSEWIFMNGPVFPRSDRMFRVEANPDRHERLRMAVFEDLPREISLGLRSGRLPARYDIRIGGHRLRGLLPPHAQILLPVEGLRAARTVNDKAGRRAHLVPIDARSELGPIWVTLLTCKTDRLRYRQAGPETIATMPHAPIVWAPEVLHHHLENLHYLEQTTPLPPLEAGVPTKLLPPGTALAAGAYQLTVHLFNPGPPQNLRLALRDLSGFPSGVEPFESSIASGLQSITWRFQKAFAPYDAPIKAYAESRGLQIYNWTLRPDPPSQIAWLRQRCSAIPDRTDPLPGWHARHVAFPGIGTWRGMLLPDPVEPGRAFTYAVRFDLDPGVDAGIFEAAILFLHVKDTQGRMIMALDYPLRKAAFTPDGIPWRHAVWPDHLTDGPYTIDAGLYHMRTRKRFRFKLTGNTPMDRRRRFFQAAAL